MSMDEGFQDDFDDDGPAPSGIVSPAGEEASLGEVIVGKTMDQANVVIVFPAPTTWIGFTPDQAREIASSLLKFANDIDGGAGLN